MTDKASAAGQRRGAPSALPVFASIPTDHMFVSCDTDEAQSLASHGWEERGFAPGVISSGEPMASNVVGENVAATHGCLAGLPP